jgi:hypothetical protein
MMQIFVLIVNIEDKIVPSDIDLNWWGGVKNLCYCIESN